MYMKTMYDVLGGKKGDALAMTYRDMLGTGVEIEKLDEAIYNTIRTTFKKELQLYCDWKHKVEHFVAWEIVEEIRTYHYL
ncbi:hypothetical protein [Terrihalobacillus insolitus]|uniref:hypothetical protein n=1 Tax=Terrihalobacillus insolitus TaxID=2950438 RepID=UPI00233F8304|nr:hypothetical protein [Terrihalobacillus insolitus]MDC3413924.1 hypothetical protein [Terrihalobacillus insolitus]